MIRFISLIALLVLLPLGALRAESLSLKSSTTVAGSFVTVGDLFEGAEAKAGERLFAAPLPGERAGYSLADIRRATDALGLTWSAPAGLETVEVERDSRLVGQKEIEAQLKEALADEGAGERLEIRLNQRDLEASVASGAPVAIDVRELSYDRRTGRFDAQIVVSAGDGPSRTLRVSGRAYNLVQLPVPAHPLRPGSAIAESDLDWIEVREDRLDRRTALRAEDLVGLVPKRSLRAGDPVRLYDVEPPLLVTKGKVVTMVYETPYMRLSTIGRALEDGPQGGVVRVLNLQSNTVVQGIATAENFVTLSNPNALLPDEGSFR